MFISYFLRIVPLIALLPLSLYAGHPDDTYWSKNYGFPGTNGNVYAMTEFEGALIVAGAFSAAGTSTVLNIAAWDGVGFSSLDSGIDGVVRSVHVFDGKLVVGGTFVKAGGAPARNLAYWDGDQWSELGGGVDGPVRTLAVINGKLWVGGAFEEAGGLVCNHIATWDGVAWLDVGGGTTSAPSPFGETAVYSIHEWENKVVVGGSFTLAGNVSARNIAAWDGRTWSALGTGRPGPVYALMPYSGELVAGGKFSAGMNPGGISKWNGSTWQSLGPGLRDDYSSEVYTLFELNGHLLAGGLFRDAGSILLNDVGEWDGLTWAPLANGTGFWNVGQNRYSTVYVLYHWNGSLYAGGQFKGMDLVPSNFLSNWDGQNWSALCAGFDGPVRAIEIYRGNLIVAGDFKGFGSTKARGIALWDGSEWKGMGSGINGQIFDLAVYKDKLYAGGWFDTANGLQATAIAAWDGESWSALPGPLKHSNGNIFVEQFTVHQGDLIVRGSFESVGSLQTGTWTQWNGSSWSACPLKLEGTTTELAQYAGSLVATGIARPPNAETAGYIWILDGTNWKNIPGLIEVYLTDSREYQGSLIVGGWVTSGNGEWGEQLIRISCHAWDGYSWNSFADPISGPLSWTIEIASYNHLLIVAGLFGQTDSSVIKGVASWDGDQLLPLGSGIGVSYENIDTDKLPIAVREFNGELYIGGSFEMAGGSVSAYLAKWNKPCCVGIRGDLDVSGSLNLLDLNWIISYLTSREINAICYDAADLDGTGRVDISDLSYLINFLTGADGTVLSPCQNPANVP